MSTTKKMPAGATVEYRTDTGEMRTGIVLKTISGLGYSILPESGKRILVPAINVKGVPAR